MIAPTRLRRARKPFSPSPLSRGWVRLFSESGKPTDTYPRGREGRGRGVGHFWQLGEFAGANPFGNPDRTHIHPLFLSNGPGRGNPGSRPGGPPCRWWLQQANAHPCSGPTPQIGSRQSRLDERRVARSGQIITITLTAIGFLCFCSRWRVFVILLGESLRYSQTALGSKMRGRLTQNRP